MGRRCKACSSIKMSELFVEKWHWRPAVVQHHSFCYYHTLGTHCHLGSNAPPPLLKNTNLMHISIGLLDSTFLKNQLLEESG